MIQFLPCSKKDRIMLCLDRGLEGGNQNCQWKKSIWVDNIWADKNSTDILFKKLFDIFQHAPLQSTVERKVQRT